ncbi:hypothetical protein M569_17414, partial [Genlisea aurea]
RRGASENQQQPLPILAVKIEIEQLIVSILDDPGVSRVMKEAGFSSTQVKSHVEKTLPLQLGPCNSSRHNRPREIKQSSVSKNRASPKTEKPIPRSPEVEAIIETLIHSKRRKTVVIVGECTNKLESMVKDLMSRVYRGEVVQGFRNVKFVIFSPLHSLFSLDGDSIYRKMKELETLIRGLSRKGVVLYLGDMNWIGEYDISLKQGNGYHQHSSFVHDMIMEIGKLIAETREDERFWVMGIATFQSYIKCRSNNGCHFSIESLWGLYPLTLPANTLGLSLISPSETEELNRPTNCSTKCQAEPEHTNLPFWLNRSPITAGYAPKFNEFTAENLNTLMDALFREVPCQREIIPQIAATILRCRSRRNPGSGVTWLLFQGPNQRHAKERISNELAKSVFGSYSRCVSPGGGVEVFPDAVSENPHRLFLIDGFDGLDWGVQVKFKKAIEGGSVGGGSGFCDAIVVLCSERVYSPSAAAAPATAEEEEKRVSSCRVDLDLNICSGPSGGEEVGIHRCVDGCFVFQIQ